MDSLQGIISTCDFVDLYVGGSFADVKGLAGVNGSRTAVPEAWATDISAIREICRQTQLESQSPEFSLTYFGVVYRVTHLAGNEPGGVFVLRRSKAEIRDFKSLGIPKYVVDVLLNKKSKGIIIICGGFGVGKTSTAASFVVARLVENGGVALAIEDPTETAIDGVHGEGRCIAISASRHNGGYREHLIRGLRSGVDFIFLGEVREAETAFEALTAGSNGELIVFTFHAGDIPQGIERFISMASQHSPAAQKMLADSLLAVVWLELEETVKGNGEIFKRLTTSSLVVTGDQAPGIREKIRSDQIPAIQQEVEQQAMRGIWG